MASSAVFDRSRWRAVERGDGEPDAVLVARAQHDPRAFAPLYERYVDQIYRYCAVRLPGPPEAEDATATTFSQALSALPRFQDRDDSFRRWLFSIAHNVVASSYRGRIEHRSLDDAWAVPDEAATPEAAAVDAFEVARVRAALVLLPEAQRRVVELRLAGLSGQEIADVLGRSHAAVKMLQLRAVDRLRDLLAPVEIEGGETR
ncbi:MAG: RNA polymerase sigma factor [Thermomicrobiales bacterium]